MTLECSHCFCFACISSHFWDHQRDCPICERRIFKTPIKNFILDAIIENFLPYMDKEIETSWRIRKDNLMDREQQQVRQIRQLIRTCNHHIFISNCNIHVQKRKNRCELKLHYQTLQLFLLSRYDFHYITLSTAQAEN